MAGAGRVPKPVERLAGHGAAKRRMAGTHLIESDPVPQPSLPSRRPGGRAWPKETREWWAKWKDDPLADSFRTQDWEELKVAAVLHAEVWGDGNVKVAPELRLRTQKFGTTAEDRARLRIQYAAADRVDPVDREPGAAKGREERVRKRYSSLRAVDGA